MGNGMVRLRVKGTRDYVTPPANAVGQAGAPVRMNADAGPLDLGAGTLVAGMTDNARPYQTANGTGRRSITFRPGMFGPNNSIKYALQDLRNQSRDQYRKGGLARSAVDNLVVNIVGEGIKPQSRASNEKFRQAFDVAFLQWTDEADSAGVMDFYGLQALAMAGTVCGGDSFTRMRVRRLNDGLSVPLQLQVLEGEQCPHLWDGTAGSGPPLAKGNYIVQGVEFNAIGQRVAYWMLAQHPGDATPAGVANPQVPNAIPAAYVAHLFKPARPGAVRGEPWLAPALALIRDLGDYLDAELTRKKTAALFVAFIKKVEDVNNALGSDDADDGGTSSLSMEPGTIQVLADNEDVEFSNPTDVGANFEVFMRECKRGIAMATGNLYEFLSGDYAALNDRTLRAAFNNFKRAVGAYQQHLMVFQWCRPILKMWMDMALLSGRLTIPTGMKPEEAYLFDWIPDAFDYIHPVQDVEGKALEIENGFTSRKKVVAAMGYDASEVDAENAADNARADKLGVKYASDFRNQASVPQKVSTGNQG